jgi:hypothetical protein
LPRRFGGTVDAGLRQHDWALHGWVRSVNAQGARA